MKIVLTGGHLTPALALLPKLLKENEVLFIGRKHALEGDSGLSFEYTMMKEMHVAFRSITTGRLQRFFTIHTIPSLLKLPIGFMQSLRILIEYKPQLVLSFGGYVSFPVAVAAYLLRIPIVTHEQTVTVGLSNKIIARMAKKICISFPESAKYFPNEKTVLTGNPLRPELFVTPKKEQFMLSDLPLLYITGGSSGSHSINMLVASVLESLLRTYVVIHQTGDTSTFRDFEQLVEKKGKLSDTLKKRYIVTRFLTVSQLAWMYRHVTLLVGRSGANTVYEILAFGLPCILIPLPWAGGSEQEANARLVERVGLGKVVHQKTLSPNLFLSVIDEMMSRIEEFRKNASKGTKFVIRNAQENIVEVISDVSKT